MIYGKWKREGLEEWDPTTKGYLRRGSTTWTIQEGDKRRVVRWASKVVGVAEAFFPHPKEWRLGSMDCPIDEASVKRLTKAIHAPMLAEPSCLKAWAKRIR